jgi:hypothetical protein
MSTRSGEYASARLTINLGIENLEEAWVQKLSVGIHCSFNLTSSDKANVPTTIEHTSDNLLLILCRDKTSII